MAGQMAWLSSLGASNKTKVLHLRESAAQPWQPYTAFTQYKVEDYKIPGGSKGWATYQALLLAKWELIPSDKARELVLNKPEEVKP